MTTESVFPVGDEDYDIEYAREAAMVDAAELIANALEASGMSQADLARRLGVSRSEVTARLKGERNITVRKLAETLHAVGGKLELTDPNHPDKRRNRRPEWRFAEQPLPHEPATAQWTHERVNYA